MNDLEKRLDHAANNCARLALALVAMTDERDRTRDIAVALEQELAEAVVPIAAAYQDGLAAGRGAA